MIIVNKCIVYIVILTLFKHFVEAQIKLEIDMLNSGFHRILTYLPYFDGTDEYEKCEYYLLQNLSSSIFINCDELNDLKRLNKLNAIYPEHVNVEKSSEESDPLSVIIGGNIYNGNKTEMIYLPIHFRYHAPSTRRFVRVNIDIPLMFLKCSMYDESNIRINDTEKYCFNGTAFSSQLISRNATSTTTTTISNTAKNYNNCDWILFKYDLHLLTQLKVNIPVGDKRFYNLIKYLTIFVSWIGMICIVLTINTKAEKYLNELKNKKK